MKLRKSFVLSVIFLLVLFVVSSCKTPVGGLEKSNDVRLLSTSENSANFEIFVNKYPKGNEFEKQVNSFGFYEIYLEIYGNLYEQSFLTEPYKLVLGRIYVNDKYPLKKEFLLGDPIIKLNSNSHYNLKFYLKEKSSETLTNKVFIKEIEFDTK